MNVIVSFSQSGITFSRAIGWTPMGKVYKMCKRLNERNM
jgi:hypothetical protein